MAKKMLLATILALVTIFLMASCTPSGTTSDTTDTTYQTGTDSESPDSGNEVSNEKTVQEEKQNTLYSFEIELEGKKLTLPCSVKDFEKTGFKLKRNNELEPSLFSSERMICGEKTIEVMIWNLTDKKQKYETCMVGQIIVNIYDKIDLTLPGGLKFDKSLKKQDVIKEYGEPDSETDDELGDSLYYYKDMHYKYATFCFVKDDTESNYVILTNRGDN